MICPGHWANPVHGDYALYNAYISMHTLVRDSKKMVTQGIALDLMSTSGCVTLAVIINKGYILCQSPFDRYIQKIIRLSPQNIIHNVRQQGLRLQDPISPELANLLRYL